ncbi:MAG: tetratricopeptide repeat protein, partial [Phenylobacterium sp.]|nr:tetratricopeptide repeat protein [Phenylobacterium sp.]
MPAAVDPLELASALHVDGQLDRAETLYRQVLAERPRELVARSNLIALLRDRQRWDEAETLMRESVALFPDDAGLAMRLASHVLAAGRYEEGWALYEARRRGPVDPPTLPFPEWDGGPVGTLLVWPERNPADILQFARFLPELQRRGVEPTLLCPPPLADLLEGAGLRVVAAAP